MNHLSSTSIQDVEKRVVASFVLTNWRVIAVRDKGQILVISTVSSYRLEAYLWPKGDFCFVLKEGYKQIFVGTKQIYLDPLPVALQLMAEGLCRFGATSPFILKHLGIDLDKERVQQLKNEYSRSMQSQLTGRISLNFL